MPVRYSARRVARPTQRSRSPVAKGSSVPLWPIPPDPERPPGPGHHVVGRGPAGLSTGSTRPRSRAPGGSRSSSPRRPRPRRSSWGSGTRPTSRRISSMRWAFANELSSRKRSSGIRRNAGCAELPTGRGPPPPAPPAPPPARPRPPVGRARPATGSGVTSTAVTESVPTRGSAPAPQQPRDLPLELLASRSSRWLPWGDHQWKSRRRPQGAALVPDQAVRVQHWSARRSVARPRR